MLKKRFDIARFVSSHASKYFFVMKLCSLLLVVAIFNVAATSNAQERFTLHFEQAKADKIIKEIEKKSSYRFFYNYRQILQLGKVDLKVIDASLKEVLQRLLSDKLGYRIIDERIVVIQAREEAFAQIEVKGKIAAQNGEPLAGVSVKVRGKQQAGVTTDNNGEFALLVEEQDVLEITHVGYENHTVTVTGKSVLNIVLKPAISNLSEVMVIGYGTQQRKNMTGSVTTIEASKLNNFKSSPSIDAMLQGQGAGLQVNQSNGTVGAPSRVLIRGTNSIFAAAEPLWVIDGIPITLSAASSLMATINPNDIATINVLKDAAATAIYGSRGANGVIIVTTKKGKGNDGTLTVDVNAGVQSLTKEPDEMGFANSEQWIALVNQSKTNWGSNLPITNATELRLLPQLANISLPSVNQVFTPDLIANTNWFDQVLQTGAYQEVNVSASRGFDKGNIFASANYRKDKGVLVNNGLERYAGRVNAEMQPVNNVLVGIRVTGAYEKLKRAQDGGSPSGNTNIANGGFSQAATGSLPIFPIYYTNGAYFNRLSGTNLAVSVDKANFRNEAEIFRSIGSLYAEYSLPFIKGLRLRTELSVDYNQVNNLSWASSSVRPSNMNYANLNTNASRNLNTNIYSTYDRRFGNNHYINVVAGTEGQRFNQTVTNQVGEDIPGTSQNFGVPLRPIGNTSASFNAGNEEYFKSYFGRLNYSFKDKFMLGGSFRRDGSSIFTEDHRWSNFAALSAGYVISNETFFKNVNWLNYAKIRASYGQTGNKNIPSVQIDQYANWPVYSTSPGSLVLTVVGSPNLFWETTNSYNAGVDFAILNDRLSGTVEYYRRDVEDLLFQVPISPSNGLQFGTSSIWANVADMRNQGWEFTINSKNISTKNFAWTTSLNITTNKNKLSGITPELDKKGSGINLDKTRSISGESLSSFYLAHYVGVDPQTGIAMIQQVDKARYDSTGKTVFTGNIIPATASNINNNRTLLEGKTSLPTYFGGLSNTLQYKGWELLTMLTFQGGNYIYNSAKEGMLLVGTGGNNLSTELIGNTWQKPGDQALYPRLMWRNSYNINNTGVALFNADGTPNNNQNYNTNGNLDRFLERGDFIRLRVLQLAYSLPQRITKKAFMHTVRVYVSANNLFTKTEFTGWDPEISKVDGDAVGRNLTQGVAGNSVPPLRTFNAGINITLK
jgi:TonB-linked SusC/RagA family outer membrane protein